MRNTKSNFTKTKLLNSIKREYPDAAGVELASMARRLADELATSEFRFKKPVHFFQGSSDVFHCSDWQSRVIVRRIDEHLRSSYDVVFPNRDELIGVLANLLKQKLEYGIVRTDVKAFFESVSFERVLMKLDFDRLTCASTNELLYSLKKASDDSWHGLPRGLPIASSLSEVWMQELDRRIRADKRVYFYSRFVDDVIAICTSDPGEVLASIRKELAHLGLSLNPKKTNVIQKFSRQSPGFEYLGYTFNKVPNQQGNGEVLSIGIANSKKKKIKQKLVKSLLAFGVDRDFDLLEKRVRFLGETYPIYRVGKKIVGLKGGPRFAYKHITHTDDLAELDEFKAKMVFSRRGRLARLSVRYLSVAERKKLASISFVSAFRLTRFNNFSARKTSEITAAFK